MQFIHLKTKCVLRASFWLKCKNGNRNNNDPRLAYYVAIKIQSRIVVNDTPIIFVFGFLLTTSIFRSFTLDVFQRNPKKRLYLTVSAINRESRLVNVPVNSHSNNYFPSDHARCLKLQFSFYASFSVCWFVSGLMSSGFPPVSTRSIICWTYDGIARRNSKRITW